MILQRRKDHTIKAFFIGLFAKPAKYQYAQSEQGCRTQKERGPMRAHLSFKKKVNSKRKNQSDKSDEAKSKIC